MSNEFDPNKDLMPEEAEWLEIVADFFISLDADTFQSTYPKYLELLETFKSGLDLIKRVDPVFFNWAKNIYKCAESLVNALRDLLSYHFETEYLDKAKLFLKAFTENVPDKLKEGFEEGKEVYDRALIAWEVSGLIVKAEGNMALGNYKEASRIFDEAMRSYRKINEERVDPFLEADYWLAEGMSCQYEQGNLNAASKAFLKSSEFFQAAANEATLAGNIFEEGKFQSFRRIATRRSSLCSILYNEIGTSQEYKGVREKLNKVQSEYELIQEFPILSNPNELRALRELTNEIDAMLVPIRRMQQVTPAFSIDSALVTELYNTANSIKENISTSASQLMEIEQRRGTIEESLLDSAQRDKYLLTIRRQISKYNDILLPSFQQAVEDFLHIRKEIETVAEENRAKGKKVPEKSEIKKNLDAAEKEVVEAKSLKTKLKEAYNSAAEFINDAKPYIRKLASAAKLGLACLGFVF